jgi:TolB protein
VTPTPNPRRCAPRAFLPAALFAFSLCTAAPAPPPASSSPRLVFDGEAELFAPGVISTAHSEIRIAFSPNGRRALWGTIGWTGGPGGWDIWESRLQDGRWIKPQPVSFNSSANDFDPAFAPDGRGVYFFSNRPGGLGGDDIWFASFDSSAARYGDPVNLGPAVNTPGNEWAPAPFDDGRRLLFASDGRGGAGRQDLFVATNTKHGWARTAPFPGAVNSSIADFDACLLHDNRTLILTRSKSDEDGAYLFVSFRRGGKYSEPVKLGPVVNAPDTFNFGPAINRAEPGVLYFTSHRENKSEGRSDIYRIRYRIE